MKSLIRSVMVIAMVIGMVTSSWAIEFREMDRDKDWTEISNWGKRVVDFNSGDGANKLALGFCQDGFYEVITENKAQLLELFQPCAYVSRESDNTADVATQFGLGFEALSMVNWNLSLFDSRTGKTSFGAGMNLSFQFDDTFAVFGK